jgi:hypothetical protein
MCAKGEATIRIGTVTFAATGSSLAATSAKSCHRSSELFTELLTKDCLITRQRTATRSGR